jgi:hypothetical protein
MKKQMHYDIIADIHGQIDKLRALLTQLGYEQVEDRFIPPVGHRALFLGDLLDSKPGYACPGGVRATLHLVKTMMDHGDAICMMGNHELNAMYFHSKGPDGKYLRIRGSKNIAMHQGTLDDFPDYNEPESEWQSVWIPWMKRLPIFLELEGLRAVHACWHPEMIARMVSVSLEDDEAFVEGANPHSQIGEALEILLKGIEVPLLDPHYFIDHTGVKRYHFRARWWETPGDGVLCHELVFPANDQIPAYPVPLDARNIFQPYDACEKPVFFGHYFKPADSPLFPESPNVACLDHSAAKDGPLVAYRWKGEADIKAENYLTHL